MGGRRARGSDGGAGAAQYPEVFGAGRVRCPIALPLALCYPRVNSVFIPQGAARVDPANRRLIRPSINTEGKEQRSPAPIRKDGPPKKVSPPEQTNAENFYYL